MVLHFATFSLPARLLLSTAERLQGRLGRRRNVTNVNDVNGSLFLSVVGGVLATARALYAQYTPLAPTRLNCRVESRQRCVLNSKLVGYCLDES